MERQDWLLVYVGLTLPGEGPAEIDPIRIMKGMFLFSQEAGSKLGNFYQFEPYHYGPCSFDIYRDLDSLEAASLIRRTQATGQLWSYAEPTASGAEQASELAKSAPTDLMALLVEQKKFVMSLPFAALLRAVYEKHPRFATRSIVSFR